MREYTDHMGTIVDLDNPETYESYPQTIEEAKDALFREIGYAIVYMQAHSIHGKGWDEAQKNRINDLIEDIGDALSVDWWRPLIWWQEQLYLVDDETENMF